jgi:hypothetical protein
MHSCTRARIARNDDHDHHRQAGPGFANGSSTCCAKTATTQDKEQKYFVYFIEPRTCARCVFMVHKHVGLETDDDRWLYMPSLDLVKRIAASDKRTSFVGSDFLYEDISGRSPEEDTHELLETTDTSYVVKNTPKKPDAVEFASYVAHIDKTTFLPMRIEYVKAGGRPYRVIEVLDVEPVEATEGGKPSPIRRSSVRGQGPGKRQPDGNGVLPMSATMPASRTPFHRALPAARAQRGLAVMGAAVSAGVWRGRSPARPLAARVLAVAARAWPRPSGTSSARPRCMVSWRSGPLPHPADPMKRRPPSWRRGFRRGVHTDAVAAVQVQGDVWYDGILTQCAMTPARPGCSCALRVSGHQVGRQVLTWALGDLVFLNDLFPKDWQSFFIGRDAEYLKAPSESVKVSLFSDILNADSCSPRFSPRPVHHRAILSYWNSALGHLAGNESELDYEKPDQWFTDAEYAARLYRTVGAYELALYGYFGFWKNPGGIAASGEYIFPRLHVYGASARGPVAGGIGNVEVAYYDSIEDPDGRDPNINNSEMRYLVGFARRSAGISMPASIRCGTTPRLPWLPESFAGDQARDEVRHVLTLQLIKLLMNQNLELSLSGYWSPSDRDVYLGRNLYKWTDNINQEVGANIFSESATIPLFGQYNADTTSYMALRTAFSPALRAIAATGPEPDISTPVACLGRVAMHACHHRDPGDQLIRRSATGNAVIRRSTDAGPGNRLSLPGARPATFSGCGCGLGEYALEGAASSSGRRAGAMPSTSPPLHRGSGSLGRQSRPSPSAGRVGGHHPAATLAGRLGHGSACWARCCTFRP